ncbi:DUF5330 domain-containing protein [Aquibium sp. A9E412]|uniref:DUF5330 domain-containing protein n=1 Tax=Aquibium sp. A9E412 TaxID=2976767 RepID=UPI0025AED754|nr:DUF5330 domain-containing protein [Aquibium sp. A9E412]MDN2566356.1 DUF5330 domain-containing protein [Aquibium sp. A9E412]
MGFLIRSAFWLSLVLLIIPIDAGSGETKVEPVGPIDAFFAARGAIQDVAGLCERQPQVCETGRAALSTIGARAREGVRMAYDAFDGPEAGTAAPVTAEATGPAGAGDDAALTTGSVPAAD